MFLILVKVTEVPKTKKTGKTERCSPIDWQTKVVEFLEK